MRRTYRILLALGWTLLILVACTIPGRDLPRVDIVSIDKVAHFTIFAGYGWFWMFAAGNPLARATRWTLATGIAYAVLTEFYQGLLPWERTPDPFDALFNILGLLTAILAFRTLQARRSA